MYKEKFDEYNNGKGLILGKRIFETIKNHRFTSFIILGDRDIGKSTYALKGLYEAFLRLGYEDRLDDITYSIKELEKKDMNPSAWWMALSCIKFKIPEVTSYLKEGTQLYRATRDKKPALVWDDLRKYAGGIQYFLNKELYNEISGLLDTIKIPINVFIGTCPNMEGVMSIIQGFDTYQINLGYSPVGGDYRIAKCYLWKTSPMGQRTLYPKFHDTFFCRLPNRVWMVYEDWRISASEDSIKGVEREAGID